MNGLGIAVPAALALCAPAFAATWYLIGGREHVHGAEQRGNPLRCAGPHGCGHRLTVGGIAPRQTRDIARENPLYVFTEIYGRFDARRPLPRELGADTVRNFCPPEFRYPARHATTTTEN